VATESTTPEKRKATSAKNQHTYNTGFPGDSASHIGIVVNRFGSSYYGRMLDGACDLLINCGHMPVVQPSYFTPQREYQAFKTLLESHCEGIIFHSDALPDTKLRELMNQHPKVVLVNRFIEGFEDRCVYVDNQAGARLAARHLRGNGHTNVAMITGPRSKLNEVETRTNAFIKEFNKEGYSIPTELIVEGDFQYESGMRGIQKLLSSSLSFTAVFVQNDSMAMGVLEVCRQKGLRVPDDLSVIGYDDHHHFGQLSEPGLTTIRQPIDEVGKRAAQMINGLISGADTVSFPAQYGRLIPELIERQSVSLLATPQNKKDQEMIKTLTSREIECLQWIAAGKTSGEIAIILSISESTANFHLKNTLDKLSSSNRAQAVGKAVFAGVINP